MPGSLSERLRRALTIVTLSHLESQAVNSVTNIKTKTKNLALTSALVRLHVSA